MSLTELIISLIDFRSFSTLWYWLAVAVTWSTTSHWVLGVPYDMVVRARKLGGASAEDLEDVVRVNVNRILYITGEAGMVLVALLAFALTCLAMLGFYYDVELCQAVFLLFAPLCLVGGLTIKSARHIHDNALHGEALYSRLHRHRLWVQAIGVVAIFITAMWGMFQNFTISLIG